jgi:phage replication O-like protein O
MGPQIENGYLKIANEIYEAFCRTNIGGDRRQVLDFVIRKTYGFNKTSDEISTKQIMQGTGLKKVAIYRARKWLKDNGFITVYKNVDSYFLTYSFQKNFKDWKGATKKETGYKKVLKGATKKCSRGLQKSASVLITKDTYTKDNQKTEAHTPQAKFLESFSGLYERMTGHPFSADKKHYIIISNLIKKHGYDALVEKSKLLACYCQSADIWFAKEGWSCFTPETLKTHWNRIIPILNEDQKKAKKSEEIYQKLKEERRRADELVKDSIAV